MRMKSPSHHDLAMLTLLRLQRHRREAWAFRAVEHRDSRHDGSELTPHGRIRLVPRIEAHTMRFCRGVSRLSPSIIVDLGKGIPGIAGLLRHATAVGLFLP